MREEDLFPANSTHLGKLQDPMICSTVNENKLGIVSNSKLIDTFLAKIST